MKALIIVPAFNVSNKLQFVLKDLQKFKEDTIIINDGSSDNTEQIIKNEGFNLINHKKNRGMGSAIKSGIKFGIANNYTHIITMDGDGQHDGKLVDEFIFCLNKNDLVLGNRFSSTKGIPTSKVSSNLFASTIVNTIFETNLNDVTCGFRGFKINKCFLEIDNNRYGFVFDQLFQSLSQGIKYSTINIPPVYFPNELLSTRSKEIIGFFDAMFEFTKNFKIHKNLLDIKEQVELKKDFRLTISNKTFWGFYIKRGDSYIIQST